MHPAFFQTAHRPWPPPTQPWRWRQTWFDLLFAHWPVPVSELRPLVPEALEIQEFDGTSWLGIVPFRMEGVMRRPLPDIPGISAFDELNVRLYVERDGKPGVWFLSLDATSQLAVWAARRFFHLPYKNAVMKVARSGQEVSFASRRVEDNDSTSFSAIYSPTSSAYCAKAGSLESFLTERYCLYAQSAAGQLYRCDIHHMPWPLHDAEAEITENSLADGFGIQLDGPPAQLHFSRRIEVVVWGLKELEERG